MAVKPRNKNLGKNPADPEYDSDYDYERRKSVMSARLKWKKMKGDIQQLTTITMSKSNIVDDGIGFFVLLTIAFIVLKLTHVINWSWWWVLSPIIAGAVIVAVLVVCYCWFLDNAGR